MVCATFVYSWRKRRLATRNSYKPENIGEKFENPGYQLELVHMKPMECTNPGTIDAKSTKLRFSLESSNSEKKTMGDEPYPGVKKYTCFKTTKAGPNQYEFE